MVFDAFRKRNSHRAHSSVTPMWRRGAAALAVGAVLGTSGVVGTSALAATNACATEGGTTTGQPTAEEAQAAADQAKAAADQAQATADEAAAAADAAAADAEKLKTAADQAQAEADQAQATADEAAAAAKTLAAEAAKLHAAAEEAQRIADEIASAPKAKDTCQPVYAEVTVTEGETAYVAAPAFTDQETGEERDMPEGTKFAFKDAQDSGIKIDENTGEITDVPTYAAPAKNVYEVLVTYPDGSTDTVAATVDVVAPNTDDKDLYQPAYEEVTVEQGETAYVAAPKYTSAETGEEIDAPAARYALKDGEIQGVEIDEETGAITVHATDAAPAKNVYEVLVTYPDGTTEVVVATVNVVETPQAKLYQPAYAPAEVERGKVGTTEAPKFTDEETGEERDMPEGTKFALNDGEIKGVTIDPETGAITVEATYAAVENVYEVLVTYPDGSSEVVVATINVIDTPVDGTDDGTDEQPAKALRSPATTQASSPATTLWNPVTTLTSLAKALYSPAMLAPTARRSRSRRFRLRVASTPSRAPVLRPAASSPLLPR